MLLLGLDTSGPGVAVAVHDGQRVLAERASPGARRHAELLTPSIAAVLAEAGADRCDLTAVAVGVGPGPFTGLRVGLVTARVLGLTLGLPVHGVCSLDALAQDVVDAAGADPAALGEEFCVATDARRREVYWARYRVEPGPRGTAARTAGPGVAEPGAVPRDGAVVAGRGATLYPQALGLAPAGAPLDVTGGAVARLALRLLAGGRPLLAAQPLYLRRPDAVEPGARKRVLG